MTDGRTRQASSCSASQKIHLKEYTKEGKAGLLFAGSTGLPIRRSNFQEHWTPAVEKAGIPGLHFHDLRYTGNTFAAESGATLRGLMDRMGHSTTRAALIYIHKTAGREKKIADALSDLVERAREKKDKGTEILRGTQGHVRAVKIRNDEGPAHGTASDLGLSVESG